MFHRLSKHLKYFVKDTPLRVLFSNLLSVFGYSFETQSLVFNILYGRHVPCLHQTSSQFKINKGTRRVLSDIPKTTGLPSYASVVTAGQYNIDLGKPKSGAPHLFIFTGFYSVFMLLIKWPKSFKKCRCGTAILARKSIRWPIGAR